MKIFDYLILVLYVGLLMFLASCEKTEILSDDIIIEEEVDSTIEYLTIPIDLSTPAENSKKTIPVVIINWIPSDDRRTVTDEVSRNLPDWANVVYDDLSITTVNKWILSNDKKVKYSIEEGSRFRGSINDATPYIGIEVVKYINVYDMPILKPNDGIQSSETIIPDYHKLFEKLKMEELVNQGVKEIWFNWTNTGNIWVPESNMSSPYTGDISNSYHRENDLPIYNSTYVVYGSVYDRWFAEMLHSRGHQYEAQLAYLNSDFFWKKFVGYPEGPPQPYYQGGKCGSTHYTPNSRHDYDYDHDEMIPSNILDWDPDEGESTQIYVNNLTWKYPRNTNFTIPQISGHEKFKTHAEAIVGTDPQSGWLIYWFQSIPSENNNIKYGEYDITNWWDIIFSWDETIEENTKLFQ